MSHDGAVLVLAQHVSYVCAQWRVERVDALRDLRVCALGLLDARSKVATRVRERAVMRTHTHA